MGLHSRILVTGGAGFIGSAVTRRLVAEGVRVLCVDKLTYAGSLDTLVDALAHPGFEFVQADICDAPRMRELFAAFQPDAVLHLAAESHVDRSIDGPGAFVQTNVTGTFTLLEAARGYWQSLEQDARARFRFVHISTDEVFGSLGPTGFFSEETPYSPSSPYSATKAASDHLVRAWQHTYGLPTLITNCSNNYGPYQFPEKLIPLTIRNALRGLPLPVYGTGENVRDWLFVEDHVSALLRVLEAGVPGETYAVGGHNECRNIDIVRRICALLDELVPMAGVPDRTALIRFVTDRPGHDQRYAIDASKIERELGWTPAETFDSGLRRTVRWYLDHPDWIAGTGSRGYEGERLGLSAAGQRA